MNEWFCTPWYRVEFEVDGRSSFSVVEKLTFTHVHLRSTRPLEAGSALDIVLHVPEEHLTLTTEVAQVEGRVVVLALDETSEEILQDYLLEQYAPALEAKSHESTSMKSVTEAAVIYDQLGALDDAIRVLRTMVTSGFRTAAHMEWLADLLLRREEHTADGFEKLELLTEGRLWLNVVGSDSDGMRTVEARLGRVKKDLAIGGGGGDAIRHEEATAELEQECQDALARLAEAEERQRKAEEHRDKLLEQHEALRSELVVATEHGRALDEQLQDAEQLVERGESNWRQALADKTGELEQARDREGALREEIERHAAASDLIERQVIELEEQLRGVSAELSTTHEELRLSRAQREAEIQAQDEEFARRQEADAAKLQEDHGAALEALNARHAAELVEVQEELAAVVAGHRDLLEIERAEWARASQEREERLAALETEKAELRQKVDVITREGHDALRARDTDFQRELESRLAAERRVSELEAAQHESAHRLETASRECEMHARRAEQNQENARGEQQRAEELAVALEDLRDAHGRSVADRDRMAQTVRSLESEVQRLEVELRGAEAKRSEEFDRLRGRVEQAETEQETLRIERDAAVQRSQRADTEVRHSKATLEELEGTYERTLEELAARSRTVAESRSLVARLTDERDLARSDRERADAALETERERATTLADEHGRAQQDIARLTQELARSRAEGAAQSNQLEEYRNDNARLEDQRRLSDAARAELETRLGEALASNTTLDGELAAARAEAAEELERANGARARFEIELNQERQTAAELRDALKNAETDAERARMEGERLREEALEFRRRAEAEREDIVARLERSEADMARASEALVAARGENTELAERYRAAAQRLERFEGISAELVRREREAREQVVSQLDDVGFQWREVAALRRELEDERKLLEDYRGEMEAWRNAFPGVAAS